jgi:hypothetical protein
MLASKETRSHRKGQYSCVFCRARKLRCNRPLPCTNCVSRGKTCHFGPSADQNARLDRTATLADHDALGQKHQQPSPVIPPPATAPPLISPQIDPGQAQLLEELQSLRKLATELEKRVVQSTSHSTDDNSRNASVSPSPGSARGVDVGLTASSGLHQVKEVVAHLERVSMVQSTRVRYTTLLVCSCNSLTTASRNPCMLTT